MRDEIEGSRHRDMIQLARRAVREAGDYVTALRLLRAPRPLRDRSGRGRSGFGWFIRRL